MCIAYHRWSHTLAAVLLLIGCTRTENKEPEPQAQATAPAPKPAASAPAPKPAASAPALTPSPVSDATLSYLEDLPDKKCRWVQHTPPGEPKTFFTLPAACSEWTLRWSPDGREALAFQAGPFAVGIKQIEEYRQALASHRDWRKRTTLRVDLVTGKSTSLSLPPRGLFENMGFDAQGLAVAFMEECYEEGFKAPPPALELVETGTGEDTKRQLLFEGQRYDLPEDDTATPGLAHAFRLEKNGQWTRFETKGTTYFSYDAEGSFVLDAFQAMQSTLWPSPYTVYRTLEDVPEDSPDFAALSAVLAPSDIGGWKQLETAGGPLYLYLWRPPGAGEDRPPHKGLVRIRGDEGLVEPEGLSFSGELTVDMRGDHVLLSGFHTSEHVLWNAKTKKIVASLNKSARHVTFWPKPSGPLAAASSPPPAAQPGKAAVRSLPAAKQLAAAFRAVYGSEQHPTHQDEENTYEISPAALEWMGDTAVLLTLAKNTSECRACSGAMGIHYLEPEGAGFVVRGSWPILVDGDDWGAPPPEWKIRGDLGLNPFLTGKSEGGGQGIFCTVLTLTELAPDRPIRRGRVFIGYDDGGAIAREDTPTKWEGRIDQPVPDRAFELVFTGSDSFTEHFQLQDGEYRRVGESHFKDRCE
ncbi:MAG: hypothetical protein JXB05_38865 [Myxococcaceae bacterium]|nr:hypothetical protein [Myxococcaceae bacterium]